MNPKDFKIAFWGTPLFALPSLAVLQNQGYTISMVVTTPDAPVGREKVITPSPVKQYAQPNDLSVFSPPHLSDEDFFKKYSEIHPDLAIIVAYGKIIPERYLSITPRGTLNIHPSLLPAYRGPSPIQSTIMSGESTTGVTLTEVDKEMDHGPIIATLPYEIPENAYAPEIFEALSKVGANLLKQPLSDYLNQKITPREQDHSQATFTRMISRDDGKIDWHQSIKKVYNKIRALNPEPGTWTTWKGRAVKIHKARPALQLTLDSVTPGTVIVQKDGLVIRTADDWLVVEEIQLEGRKRLHAADFARGNKEIDGTVLE